MRRGKVCAPVFMAYRKHAKRLEDASFDQGTLEPLVDQHLVARGGTLWFSRSTLFNSYDPSGRVNLPQLASTSGSSPGVFSAPAKEIP
jgi:hypothetical protein